jgi:hypothetical protein
MNREKTTTAPGDEMRSNLRTLILGLRAALPALVIVSSVAGCATVRPEQRATLADPTMRFEGEPGEQAALEHALENREASYGGGSVKGGGCGCN